MESAVIFISKPPRKNVKKYSGQ
uniref:Uncharacterized protein n=1 Tax=Arundo donax TaxID=35708 RepID=A0A0A9FJJ0_ARUDO